MRRTTIWFLVLLAIMAFIATQAVNSRENPPTPIPTVSQ